MSHKYQFVAAQASAYPVTALCRVLELAHSGYYVRQKQYESARTQRDQQLIAQVASFEWCDIFAYHAGDLEDEIGTVGARGCLKTHRRLAG
jgi:hypothetical protein